MFWVVRRLKLGTERLVGCSGHQPTLQQNMEMDRAALHRSFIIHSISKLLGCKLDIS